MLTSLFSDMLSYENRPLLSQILRLPQSPEVNLRDQKLCSADMRIIVQEIIEKRKPAWLDLTGNRIDVLGVKILAEALEKDNPLTALMLGDNRLLDDGLAVLCRILNVRNSNLIHLDVSGNGITTEGLKSLCQSLKTNRTLIELDMQSNRIDDEGVKLLTDVLVESNYTLRHLYLDRNPSITDSSIESLIYLLNKSEVNVSMFGCSLSREGIDRLNRATRSLPSYRLTF